MSSLIEVLGTKVHTVNPKIHIVFSVPVSFIVPVSVTVIVNVDPLRILNKFCFHVQAQKSLISYFWLSVGSPISPDVRPGSGRRAKILSQF